MAKLNDKEQIDGKLELIARRSKVFYRVFLVILGGYLVVTGIALAAMIVASQGILSSPLLLVTQGIPQLIIAAIGIVVLLVIVRIFKDLSQRVSPFTMTQAKRITAIGILLLVDVVVEFAISLNSPAIAALQEFQIGYQAPYMTGNVYINLTFIVAALICFSLSYVFRYGSLLQWMTDETV